MDGVSITYDLLFDILRFEKSREELQALDKNFYSDIVNYLQTKEAILINSQTPVSERELTRIQLNNIKKILTELYERREKKIISLALYKIKTGAETTSIVLEEEKLLFDELFELLSRYQDSILTNILNSRLPKILRHDQTITIQAEQAAKVNELHDDDHVRPIRFLSPVPRFLGPELEIYGPFEEHDMASLPAKIANALISKGRAEEVKME